MAYETRLVAGAMARREAIQGRQYYGYAGAQFARSWAQRVGESAAPSVLLSRTWPKEEFRQNEAGEGSHRGVVSRQIVAGTTVRDATGFWVVAGAASDYGKWWILVASFVLFLSRDALLRMSAAA